METQKNEHLYKGILFLLLTGVSYFVIILAIALPLLPLPLIFMVLGIRHLLVFFKVSLWHMNDYTLAAILTVVGWFVLRIV